jgi:hypothetical protein
MKEENYSHLKDNVLKEIEERCNKARPSPWKSYIEGRDHESGSDFIMVGDGVNRQDDIELHGTTDADQDFIAYSRQDIPLLLVEIKRLRKLL